MQKCRHFASFVDGCYGNKEKQPPCWVSGKPRIGHNFEHFESKFWIWVLRSSNFILMWAFFEILKNDRFFVIFVKKVVKNAFFCCFEGAISKLDPLDKKAHIRMKLYLFRTCMQNFKSFCQLVFAIWRLPFIVVINKEIS